MAIAQFDKFAKNYCTLKIGEFYGMKIRSPYSYTHQVICSPSYDRGVFAKAAMKEFSIHLIFQKECH